MRNSHKIVAFVLSAATIAACGGQSTPPSPANTAVGASGSPTGAFSLTIRVPLKGATGYKRRSFVSPGTQSLQLLISQSASIPQPTFSSPQGNEIYSLGSIAVNDTVDVSSCPSQNGWATCTLTPVVPPSPYDELELNAFAGSGGSGALLSSSGVAVINGTDGGFPTAYGNVEYINQNLVLAPIPNTYTIAQSQPLQYLTALGPLGQYGNYTALTVTTYDAAGSEITASALPSGINPGLSGAGLCFADDQLDPIDLLFVEPGEFSTVVPIQPGSSPVGPSAPPTPFACVMGIAGFYGGVNANSIPYDAYISNLGESLSVGQFYVNGNGFVPPEPFTLAWQDVTGATIAPQAEFMPEIEGPAGYKVAVAPSSAGILPITVPGNFSGSISLATTCYLSSLTYHIGKVGETNENDKLATIPPSELVVGSADTSPITVNVPISAGSQSGFCYVDATFNGPNAPAPSQWYSVLISGT